MGRKAAPRDVVFHTLTTYPDESPRQGSHRITVYGARCGVSAGRRTADTVTVYDTTDRDGTAMHIAYVHWGPGYWSGPDTVTEIYEIPTAALTRL